MCESHSNVNIRRHSCRGADNHEYVVCESPTNGKKRASIQVMDEALIESVWIPCKCTNAASVMVFCRAYESLTNEIKHYQRLYPLSVCESLQKKSLTIKIHCMTLCEESKFATKACCWQRYQILYRHSMQIIYRHSMHNTWSIEWTHAPQVAMCGPLAL